jgi:hypothetical protein
VYIGGPAVESYLTPIVAILGWPLAPDERLQVARGLASFVSLRLAAAERRPG